MIRNPLVNFTFDLVRVMNVYVKQRNERTKTMKIEKDRTMFGTKVYNNETKEYGILIYTWTNHFADGDILFATCIDINGKKYNTSLDNLILVEE